jgi:HPt (histidine-containing phosphotransfer) domain-containing protein
MVETGHQNNGLYSRFGTDPDLGELVDLFVAEMPARIESILVRAERRDWESLRRSAHQLKGSAGSYGFSQLTTPAMRLETAIKDQREEALILEMLQELVDLCRLVRGGAPADES